MQRIIEQLGAEPGVLIAVCARPGQGRRTFAIALANTLAEQGKAVCFYSFSHSRMGLDDTISPQVRRLNTPVDPIPENAYLVVDDLPGGYLELTACHRDQAKTKLLTWLRRLAQQKELRVVVTDTYAHHIGPPPLSADNRKHCHAVYELRRKPDATMRLAELPRT